MSNLDQDVIPPMPRSPRVPSIETFEAEAKEQTALPPKNPSQLAAAGALFVVLLSALSLVFGAITLVMF